MTTPGAAYLGSVVHKRVRPKRHALRYRVFAILFDLDRLTEMDKALRLFSLNRFNIFALFARDFGLRDGSSLADFARARAKRAGLDTPVARVRMLAYPRIFGYAFNPLTVYFLDDAAGRTGMLLYEVRNTFGEHHFYEALIDQPGPELTHEAPKAFYVSPFNAVEGTYRFSIRPPTDAVFTGITLTTGEGAILTAYFEGKRQPLSDRTLIKLAFSYPLMTAKVLAGIHWEALKLWLKGVPPTLKIRRQLRGHKPAPH